MKYIKILVPLLFHYILPVFSSPEKVKEFLRNDFDTATRKMCSKVTTSLYLFQTDLKNPLTKENFVQDSVEAEKMALRLGKTGSNVKGIPAHERKGKKILSNQELEAMYRIYADMLENFGSVKICFSDLATGLCHIADDELNISEVEYDMEKSEKIEQLQHMWEEWRDVSAKWKNNFKSYTDLKNRSAYTIKFLTSSFQLNHENEEKALNLWNDVKPLYVELHKYVTNKLKAHWGAKLDVSDGLLPAHVLGNLWGDNWYNIEPIVRPFPDVSDGNIDGNIQRLMTLPDMYKAANEFFQSIGFNLESNMALTHTYKDARKLYWSYRLDSRSDEEGIENLDQMIEFLKDGRVVCRPTSYDFCNGSYRIIMCPSTNVEHFLQVHHEVGRFLYPIHHETLGFYRKNSPSPAFHEAVGDAIGLSATSPSHLHRLGLLSNFKISYESSINYLMKIALLKIPVIPYSLLVDVWRWSVYNGTITPDQYNSEWWELRKKYQMVKPPVPRTEEYFDPGAEYHVIADKDYMPNFFAYFLQFQIYKFLCLDAEAEEPVQCKTCPIHNCDFYKSGIIQKELKVALRYGYIKEWTGLIKNISGSEEIVSDALLEYFQPLYEFLKKENERTAENNQEATKKATIFYLGIALGVCILCIILPEVYKRWKEYYIWSKGLHRQPMRIFRFNRPDLRQDQPPERRQDPDRERRQTPDREPSPDREQRKSADPEWWQRPDLEWRRSADPERRQSPSPHLRQSMDRDREQSVPPDVRESPQPGPSQSPQPGPSQSPQPGPSRSPESGPSPSSESGPSQSSESGPSQSPPQAQRPRRPQGLGRRRRH